MFKKLFLILFIFILSFSVYGCSVLNPQINSSQSKNTSASTTSNTFIESAEYEITKVDNSLRNAKGQILIDNSYELVTIKGDNKSFAKINAHFKKQMDAEMLSDNELKENLNDVYLSPQDPYCNSWFADVSYNDNGYFIISASSSWFMGGVADGRSYSLAYNLNNGEAVKLNELMGLSENDAVLKLRGIAYSGLIENYGDEFFDFDGPENLSEYKIDDFNYYIKDNEIILVFQKYEFACGASGPSETSTGIYLNK